jgi:type I site-specific restriction endonuclease
MRAINEDEAELLIEEHLRAQSWNLTDFTLTYKRWREDLDGEEADRVLLYEGKMVAILEAKKPGKDLWAALDQAKPKAGTDTKTTGHDLPPLFASDGMTYLRQIHAGEP